jgi:hypothetical protein
LEPYSPTDRAVAAVSGHQCRECAVTGDMKETIVERLAEMRAFFHIFLSKIAKKSSDSAHNGMFLLAFPPNLDISKPIVTTDLTVIFR